MSLNRRQFNLALGVATLPLAAQASTDFPTKPLRLVVPLTPGSSSDAMCRYVADKLGQELGKPVVVENRPGGDTVIAVQNVLQAPADGYTMVMASPASMTINPLINPKLPYKPSDLRVLMATLRNHAVIVTAPDGKLSTMQAALAAAKQAPKGVSLATYSPHYRLSGLRLQEMAGVKFNEVAYKGAPQMQTDVIGGSVDLGLFDVGGTLPLIQTGKLKALAVTGKKRHVMLPNVPTVIESGVPGYEAAVWIGFAVPAKTPDAVAKRLVAALQKVTRTPEFKVFVDKTTFSEILAYDEAKSNAMIQSENDTFRKLVKDYNITLN